VAEKKSGSDNGFFARNVNPDCFMGVNENEKKFKI